MLATFIIIFLVICRFYVTESRAYGQRVEYRYEYDPNNDVHPRVHVKFDDVSDENELMRIFNNRNRKEVRKSPSKHGYITPNYFSNDETYYAPFSDTQQHNRDVGWKNLGSNDWHRGFAELPVQNFALPFEKSRIAEQMAEFLRRQSETILSSQFPDIPRSSFHDPPQFKFHRTVPFY